MWQARRVQKVRPALAAGKSAIAVAAIAASLAFGTGANAQPAGAPAGLASHEKAQAK